MARREQWRGHFHAVIKYLLEPARDDKADASGGQGSPGRRYSPGRAQARVRDSKSRKGGVTRSMSNALPMKAKASPRERSIYRRRSRWKFASPHRQKMSESGCILNINRYKVKIDVLFGDDHRPYL